MKTTITILAFLFAFLACAKAQQGRWGKNSLGISAGWQQLKFLDEHASPLRYEGTTTPLFGLNYMHSGARTYFHVKAAGGIGSANPSRFGARNYMARWNEKDSFQYQISSLFAHAQLEATYLKKLNPSSSGPLGYWLGGTINEQAYYADEVANMPWLINAAEFSPSFKMDYQPHFRHQFSLKIDLAGIAFFSRTVYGLFAKSNKDNNVVAYLKQGSRLVYADQYRKIGIELNYTAHVSRRIALGGSYGLKWMRYSFPKPLRAVDNRFWLNVNYSINQR
ncbi:MAG: hypothetical protein INR73_16470 [Williamsia sp.]|nr:hypothetical protein [Williamsia sp.]